MPYRIRKEFTFAASHILNGLPEGHKCGRLHGHNYTVVLELSAARLDLAGFVVDFGELRPFATLLDGTFDHRHLNDVMSGNPTAERLAEYLFHAARSMWAETTAVKVHETASSSAEFRP